MSYFNRLQRHGVVQVLKQEELDSSRKVQPLLKADSEPMQQTATANQASGAAYQSQVPERTDVGDQIKAHKAAANAHFQAAKGHRVAGKAAQADSSTVAAAHYQQARSHDQQAQSHQSQAQDMQDAKDQGYF